MSNAILIKEVNNSPVIFNVDNAIDIANLEALQAVKMAEEMVNSIFGEQANFADNTTTVVAPNADNPQFPWNAVFDSSKILEKPKRKLGTMAGLAMPSNKYIDIAAKINAPSQVWGPAPADGFLVIDVGNATSNTSVQIYAYINGERAYTVDKRAFYGIAGLACTVPIRKGCTLTYWLKGTNINIFRFVYAEGEI